MFNKNLDLINLKKISNNFKEFIVYVIFLFFMICSFFLGFDYLVNIGTDNNYIFNFYDLITGVDFLQYKSEEKGVYENFIINNQRELTLLSSKIKDYLIGFIILFGGFLSINKKNQRTIISIFLIFLFFTLIKEVTIGFILIVYFLISILPLFLEIKINKDINLYNKEFRRSKRSFENLFIEFVIILYIFLLNINNEILLKNNISDNSSFISFIICTFIISIILFVLKIFEINNGIEKMKYFISNKMPTFYNFKFKDIYEEIFYSERRVVLSILNDDKYNINNTINKEISHLKNCLNNIENIPLNSLNIQRPFEKNFRKKIFDKLLNESLILSNQYVFLNNIYLDEIRKNYYNYFLLRKSIVVNDFSLLDISKFNINFKELSLLNFLIKELEFKDIIKLKKYFENMNVDFYALLKNVIIEYPTFINQTGTQSYNTLPITICSKLILIEKSYSKKEKIIHIKEILDLNKNMPKEMMFENNIEKYFESISKYMERKELENVLSEIIPTYKYTL